MIAGLIAPSVLGIAARSLPDASALPLEDEPKPADVRIGGDANQRYLLHGPGKVEKGPTDGWRLLVVMPGGDGSADFAPFVGRIRENALGKDWLIAQIVAPKWDDKQAETNVWPTERRPYPKMKFPTEKLFEAVLEDLGKQRKIDPRFVLTLSWSSSGPTAYALALDPKSRVTGSFVAMSVFRPGDLPPLKNAAGRRFYILHSPQDQQCDPKMAELARDELEKAGAIVEFATYEGGHGWHGDVFGGIRKGVDWLGDKSAKPSKDKPAKGKPSE